MNGGATGTEVAGGYHASPNTGEVSNKISMVTNNYNSNLYQESLAPLIFMDLSLI